MIASGPQIIYLEFSHCCAAESVIALIVLAVQDFSSLQKFHLILFCSNLNCVFIVGC